MSLFSGEQYEGLKIQNTDQLTVNLSAASVAQTIFVAPVGYKVIAAHVSFATASAGATVNVEVLGAGVAKGSGTSVFATALALTGTANTVVTTAAPTGNNIPQNQRLAIVLSGSLVGLVDGYLQLEVAKA